MASSISRQAPKRPSTTKSVSTPARPSLTRTQSNTSKVRANSAGAPSPSGRTRTPKVVSKKPRREKRSRSARISRWRAWKNASEGNETDIDFGPKAYSRRAGCVKPELAMARLGSGVERQGSLGELVSGTREGEEPRGLAQHGGVDEEPPVPALGHDHHLAAALPGPAVRAVDRVRRRDEGVGGGEDGELLRWQRGREVGRPERHQAAHAARARHLDQEAGDEPAPAVADQVDLRGTGGEADGVDQVAQPGGEALVVEARWIREGREVAHAAPRKVAAQEEEVRRVPEQPVHQHDRRRVGRTRIEAIALDHEAERHRERRGAQRRNFGPDHPQADHPPPPRPQLRVGSRALPDACSVPDGEALVKENHEASTVVAKARGGR